MPLMIRLMRSSALSKKIEDLKREQDTITRIVVLDRDLDAVGRAALDIRERELIQELLLLQAERTRRGRRLAESHGFIGEKR